VVGTKGFFEEKINQMGERSYIGKKGPKGGKKVPGRRM